MPPNNQAQPNTQQPKMSADEAASHLGFATNLSQQLMQYKSGQQPQGQPVEGSKTSQNAPQQEQKAETKKEAPKEDVGALMAKMELNITKKLDDMRKEMKDDQIREIDGIKKDIALALNEEDTEEKAK